GSARRRPAGRDEQSSIPRTGGAGIIWAFASSIHRFIDVQSEENPMVASRVLLGGAVLTAAVSVGLVQLQGQGTAPPPAPLPPALLECDALAAALRPLAANDARLRDWANLNRYRQANAEVTSADVVFMGDSITDAWPQPRYGAFFPGKNYVGRGISGQTTPQMLIRMRPDVVAHKPKVVVILAGTNDIAGNTGPMTNEEIAGNIESMAE